MNADRTRTYVERLIEARIRDRASGAARDVPAGRRCTTSGTVAASAPSRSPRPRSTSASSTPWRAFASRSTWRRGTSTRTSRSASVSTSARSRPTRARTRSTSSSSPRRPASCWRACAWSGLRPPLPGCGSRARNRPLFPVEEQFGWGPFNRLALVAGHPGRADARIRPAGQEPPPPGCRAARGDRAHPGADASGDRSVGRRVRRGASGSSSRPACSATSSSSTSRWWCCGAGCRASRRGIRSTPGSSGATATRSRSRSPTSPAPRHASMRSRRRSRCPTRGRFPRSLR